MIGKTVEKLALSGFGFIAPTLAFAQEIPEGMDPETYEQFLLASAQMGDPFAGQTYAAAIGLVVTVIAALYFASQREKRNHDLLVRFLDKGESIPRDLFPPPPSRERELRRGVWLLSLGLGIGLVLFVASGDWATAAWGLIPLFLGAASFINAVLFYRSPSSGGQSGNGL